MNAPDNAFVSLRMPHPELPVVLWYQGRCDEFGQPSPLAVLPGAFNPVHRGHRQLRSAAAQHLGCDVLYEISVENVDKPALNESDVRQRLKQMGSDPVLLTHAPLFTDKARLLPGAWFVVGYDTAIRIVDPLYYDRSQQRRDAALRQLQSAGVRFLVAGRLDTQSEEPQFLTRSSLVLSQEFESLFEELPEELFRMDLSSSEIRHGLHGTADEQI